MAIVSFFLRVTVSPRLRVSLLSPTPPHKQCVRLPPMKVISWVIAFLGLWEFGDVAAFFTPGFGRVPAFLWNHIIVGLVLMVVGVWAALAREDSKVKTLHWIAAVAGAWLVAASFILGSPVASPGLWNDVIVGGIVAALGVAGAMAGRRVGA
jgi:hypothetical protein